MHKYDKKGFNYPEHEKLKMIQDKTSMISSFLWWCLTTKNARLFVECPEKKDANGKVCKVQSYNPAEKSIHSLVHEFFGIDESKLEKEKKMMLESIKKIRKIDP